MNENKQNAYSTWFYYISSDHQLVWFFTCTSRNKTWIFLSRYCRLHRHWQQQLFTSSSQVKLCFVTVSRQVRHNILWNSCFLMSSSKDYCRIPHPLFISTTTKGKEEGAFFLVLILFVFVLTHYLYLPPEGLMDFEQTSMVHKQGRANSRFVLDDLDPFSRSQKVSGCRQISFVKIGSRLPKPIYFIPVHAGNSMLVK